MTRISKSLSTLVLIPALAVSAVASARTLGSDDDQLAMTVLALSDDGSPVHANFGPYDVEVDGVGVDSFHFELQVAEQAAWIAACAMGDGSRLLCRFYSPTGDAHGFLAVDTRDTGLTTGTLQGPGVDAEIVVERAGWTVTSDQAEVAGVSLRGRDKVWFDRSSDLDTQPLLAAAAGALLVFDELR